MIETLEQTGSTNADLLDRLRANKRVAEGDWLIAKKQISGRGRQGRVWFDGNGNFMGSTVVHTNAAAEPFAHSLALVAGLAVYETLIAYLPQPGELQLKWPNDLLLKGVKLAGILLERQNDAVVIGIGVNLRATPDLPDRQTIALAHVTSPPALPDFADALMNNFDKELERWRHYGLEILIRRWSACAHALGTAMSVHDGGGDPLVGHFDGLDADGGLLLRVADGSTRTINAGDIVIN